MIFTRAVFRASRLGTQASKKVARFFSATNNDLVLTKIEDSVATLTLNRSPVNSLSLELCQAISESIKTAEASSNVHSLVLASSFPSLLSAGLDLMEMHQPDQDRLHAFWSSFQQVYLDLYGSRLACMAAIEGHAPAAGCMLALCCDYRIMTSSSEAFTPTIGLNESKLGIVAPPFMGEMFVNTVGRREADKSLALGTLYSPEDALHVGLVDEVVPKDKVLIRAQEEAEKWAKIPSEARFASKMLTREKELDHLKATREKDAENFVNMVNSDRVQSQLGLYIEMLKKKQPK